MINSDNVLLVTLEYEYEGNEILALFRGNVDIKDVREYIENNWSSNKFVWDDSNEANMYNSKGDLIVGQKIQINRLTFDEIVK